MDRKIKHISWVSFCAAALLSQNLMAAPFTPVFELQKTEGACSVIPPNAKTAKPAESGKAYAYGTTLFTGNNGTMQLTLSGNNTVGVEAGANFSMENGTAESMKVANIESGKLILSLEENYEANNTLVAATPCATMTCLKGGKYIVEARNVDDLFVVVVSCENGELKIAGAQFEIPLLKKGEVVSISCSADKGFVRIRDVAGKYDLIIKDNEASPKVVAMEADMVVKILQRRAQSGETIVSALIEKPDGQMDSVTYSKPSGEEQPGQKPLPELKVDETTQPTTAGGAGGEGDFFPTEEPLPVTTTTTYMPYVPPVTTTTHRHYDVPDVTPVGRS